MHQDIYIDLNHQILRSKRRSIFRKVVSMMACTVMFCTTYALILPAITMEETTFCGKEDHTHSEECYAPTQKNILICNGEHLDIHVHSDGCYGPEGVPVCGQCDYVAHAHDDGCWNEAGELVCTLEERSVHIHGDSCYVPGETLPEVLHVHSDACNALERGELTCTQEELEGHAHGDGCYEPGDVLLCAHPENHVHADACYQLPLICGISTEPHGHGSDCYGRGSLTCGTEEGHVHGDGCRETVSICADEAEDHSHNDSCYETRTVCHIPENHSHGDSCYESIVVCGKEEGEQHTHGDGCYSTEAELICTDVENHVHEGGCYEPRLVCTTEEIPGHAHGDECYEQVTVIACGMNEGDPEPTEPVEPVLVCTEAAAQVHVHGEGCFKTEITAPTPICGTEAEGHEHTIECYALGCGLEEHEHTLACNSDPEADVESQATWEATMSSVTLTGDKPTDVVTIAKSQLGYTESTRNYAVWEDNSIHGYTRYGAWYGVPYGDWCGMFASFCLRYAGVNDIPINYGVRPWIEELSALGLYYRAWETKPQVGSLIFYDWEGDGLSDHVGIVAEVHEADEYSGASITAIEGNASNCVQYVTYASNDSVILGYGLLPGQEPIPVIEETDPEHQINMDISKGPVVILTAKKIEGEEITPEEGIEERVLMFAATPRSSNDLKDYLGTNGSILFTLKNTDNTEILKDSNGNYLVDPDTPYTLSMSVQSPHGFAPGSYTYQLPSAIRVKAGSGNLEVSGIVLGTWFISENGLVTFEFNDTSNTYTEATLTAHMSVTFLETEDIIEIDQTIKVDVKEPPEQEQINIELGKWGGLNDESETPSIVWQIQINVNDGANIAGTVIKDNLTSPNHRFTEQDRNNRIVIATSNPYHVWHVSESDVNIQYWSDTDWAYKMPETAVCVECGQTITLQGFRTYNIYYTSTPDNYDLNGIEHYENHVEFGGHDKDGLAQVNHSKGPMGVHKSGNFQSDSNGGKFIWNLKVQLPGMIPGQKAVDTWRITDGMDVLNANYQSIRDNQLFNHIDNSTVTITRNGKTSELHHVDNATTDDEIVWDYDRWSNSLVWIYFYCRCNCTESTCQKWNNNACGETHKNGFCRCWTITDNVEIVFTYETPAKNIIEHYTENGKYITNLAELWHSAGWQHGGNASVEIPSIFEKQLAEDFGGSGAKKYIASYTITLNEAKQDISPDGTPITITDEMTPSLVYLAGTMVITAEDIYGNTTVLNPGTDYTLTYDGNRTDKHVLTIVLNNPQMAMYTLKYDTTIYYDGSNLQNITYQNWAKVNVWSKQLTADTDSKIFSDLNFLANTYKVNIFKTIEGTNVPLPGATFGLYNKNGGLIVSDTTDNDGKLTFITDIQNGIILLEHTPYYIQEISAPEGFVLDTNKYWFYFCNKGDGCTEGAGLDDLYPNSVRIPRDEIYTFNRTNTREGYELPETGGAGTIPYTMAGLLLMLSSAAYLMYYSYKPRRREEL